MRLSLQPGLNEKALKKLQRNQRKRNCEKRKKNFEAIDRNSYLCNPNRKDGKRGRERRGEEERMRARYELDNNE